jgi:hypothetical protein
MIKKNVTFALVLGLGISNSILASNPKTEKLDLNSIIYIEDDEKIELGFDTADYLPENFDPYKSYFDLNSIAFIEEEPQMKRRIKRKLVRRLPKGFDPYADPKGILGINYIDENDTIVLDFDSKQYLPKGFNAFAK